MGIWVSTGWGLAHDGEGSEEGSGNWLVPFVSQTSSASCWTMGPQWMTQEARAARASPLCMMPSIAATLKWLSCSLNGARRSPCEPGR